MSSYRESFIHKQIEALQDHPNFVALWEGGSAATGTTDEYSDIDLFALCSCELEAALQVMESAMPPITHYHTKRVDSEAGQRIYFCEGAPKHWVADVCVIAQHATDLLQERMVVERHGAPVTYFDKQGVIKPCPVNTLEWQAKLEARVKELEDAFPIYILQVLKPLDRHHNSEAFAFYYHGLLRKWVELLGIRYRPYRYDFELRYLERDFPPTVQLAIHEYMQFVDAQDLRQKTAAIERDFRENIAFIKAQGIQLA